MDIHCARCQRINTLHYSGQRGVTPDKCPQVMSVGADDRKFENDNNVLSWSNEEVSLPDLWSPLLQ